MAAADGTDGDPAGAALHRDFSPIPGSAIPLVGWPVSEQQGVMAGGVIAGRGRGGAAELAGAAAVEILKGRVKPADAGEPRRQRDFGHGQAGLVDQLSGKVN